MNSKNSYTLCTSSSDRTREKLPSGNFDAHIDKRLLLAQQKLRPVIDDVMRTATENATSALAIKSHYLTVEQYEDAIWASQLLKEVDKIISENQNGKRPKKKYNTNNFNLERENVKVNKCGKIYVDTSILVQLIELDKSLSDAINYARETQFESNFSNDITSYTQTEHSNSGETCDTYEEKYISSDEKFNVVVMRKKDVKPKIKINVVKSNKSNSKSKKLETKTIQEILGSPTSLAGKKILVMSAHTMKTDKSEDKTPNNNKALSTLSEERTFNSEVSLSDSGQSSRKIKSTGSIQPDIQNSKVTNVAGARRIIINCLHDLKRVRSFLEKVDIGVSAEVQIQNAVIDHHNNNNNTENSHQSNSDKEKRHSGQKENNDVEQPVTEKERRHSGQKENDNVDHSNTEKERRHSGHKNNNEENGHELNTEKEKRHSEQKEHGHHSKKNIRFDSEPTSSEAHLANKSDENLNMKDKNVYKKELHPSLTESKIKSQCSCGSTDISETPMELLLDAGDENASKLIICIKGKSEEDGDVQIIIRQCSECKIVGGKVLHDDQTKDPDKKHLKQKDNSTNVSPPHNEEKHEPHNEERKLSESADKIPEINVIYDSADTSKPHDPLDMKEGADHHKPLDIASITEIEHEKNGINPDETKMEQNVAPHGSDDKDHPESVHETDHEKTGINVIFDPENPSQSIVESPKKDSSESSKNIDTSHHSPKVKHKSHEKDNATAKEGQSKIECSKIKLYETTNLCFTTDDGQELMISLTIKPKTDGSLPKISLKDIFSESTTGTGKTSNEHTEHTNSIFGSDRDITIAVQDKQDLFIPLSRTKICSSLEFDVSVMETTIKNEGIKHINPGIVVRLKEMGVNNLLRACRPVKCGRPMVLNEKIRKSIPYSASLKSLPLEEADANIINQSLHMSFNKSKYSPRTNGNKTMAFFTELSSITDNMKYTNNMQISFVHIQIPRILGTKNQTSLKTKYVRKKLNYYINLLHDTAMEFKECIYKVYFFEIKKYRKEFTSNLLSDNHDARNYDSLNDDSLKSKPSLHSLELKKDPESPASDNKKNIMTSTYKVNPHLKKRSDKLENNTVAKEKINKFVSKIPVYKYKRKMNLSSEEKLSCESDVYDISSQSLPKDDEDVMKDFNLLSNMENKLKNTVKMLKLEGKCNSVDRDQDINLFNKKAVNNQEIDASNKTSDDSFELYFNNFFRDKYFSKLALCQEQSSICSFKLRKKKSECHSLRSQSQVRLGESNLSLRHSSTITCRTKCESEKIKNKTRFEDIYKNGNVEAVEEDSQHIIYYFTKILSGYLIKDMLHEEKQDFLKKIKNINNISLAADNLKNKMFQTLLLNLKKRNLEATLNKSTFPSQPDVEAGMDSKDSFSCFNISNKTLRTLEENITYSLIETMTFDTEDFQFLRPLHKFEERVNSLVGIKKSYIDLKKSVVKFDSSTSNKVHIRSTSANNENIRYLKCFLPNDFSTTLEKADYSVIGKVAENACSDADSEPLRYLVYQHYLSRPSLFQRIMDKFKSTCGSSKHGITVEYLNDSSVMSLEESMCLCGKCGHYIKSKLPEKSVDTIDYCMCSRGRPSTHTKELHKRKKSSSRRSHKRRRPAVNDPECKICGCTIAECKSKHSGNHCACPKKLKKNSESLKSSRNVSSKRSFGKSSGVCRSKKSIGMICHPKNVDISVCVKIGSNVKQKSKRKCCCIKCEKRSPDGSCYCSHCLGIFDKSVDTRPSNNETGTQCICHQSTNVEGTKDMKTNSIENEQSKTSAINNSEINNENSKSPANESEPGINPEVHTDQNDVKNVEPSTENDKSVRDPVSFGNDEKEKVDIAENNDNKKE